MIYIAMALYQEAVPLIRQWQLKLVKNTGSWQEYENPEKQIRLFLTGVGKVEAGISVSHMGTKYQWGQQDFLLQIGSCAGTEVGQMYVIHKIEDGDTGRTYYPDILYSHSLQEHMLQTGSCLLQTGTDKRCLYDMEASGVYQGAIQYIGQHQMAFLKIVSDAGIASEVTPKAVTAQIEKHVPEICEFVEQIRCYMQTLSVPVHTTEELHRREMLYRDMCCSESMKWQMHQTLEYLRCAKKPYWEEIQHGYRTGILPCKNRKEGKKYLETFKNRVIR